MSLRKTTKKSSTNKRLWSLFLALAISACGGGGGGGGSPQPPAPEPPPPELPPDPAPVATEFPVRAGEVGMTAEDNPRQQPFACQTFETVLGQPQVDNDAGIGYPVTDPGGPAPSDHGAIDGDDIIGYSADCGAPMQVRYFYKPAGSPVLQPLSDPANPPSDTDTVEIDGETFDYIVRQEIGTLNRFIYAIYMLSPSPGEDDAPDLSAWNGGLVFSLRGGAGVGHSQANGDSTIRTVSGPGDRRDTRLLLERGYAVASSTGTAHETTSNLRLNAQTADMVKRQFAAAYAEPEYTFGFGISGGAIQQQYYAERAPGLLDALLLIDTFGDSVTEFLPIGDCELLEFYFDRVEAAVNGTGAVNPKWEDWENRQLVEGYNAANGAATRFDDGSGRPLGSSAGPGSSLCIEGYRGGVPLMLNPRFVHGSAYELIRQTQPQVYQQTRFSYFEDLKDTYGLDPASGFARSLYDNVGVQYGLGALADGDITVEEFLLLNAHVGGYKQPWEFASPGFPFVPDGDPDPWSSRNATARDHMTPGAVAPRTEGSLEAMEAAYSSGIVFLGNVDLPMLVVDGYQERQLDQHHSREKFEIRERMLRADGDASNLVLWTVDTANGGHDEAVSLAAGGGISLLHAWLRDDARPAAAEDACFDADGDQIARGTGVYDGILTEDTGDDGTCSEHFPVYGTPRAVAGAPLAGHTLKCHLKTVEVALEDGTYGDVTFTEAEQSRLKAIFPDGVCDYSKGDMARSEDV